MDIKNGECLLWIAQNKNDEEFDQEHYTELMHEISKNLYELPLINEETLIGKMAGVRTSSNEVKLSDYPLDELFMWSILIYSGKEQDMDLIKYYWSLTTKPVACALTAMIVYDRFMQKSFINRELKEQLKEIKKEFEKLAMGVLKTASLSKVQEAQDIILRQNKYFLNHTALQLGVEAEAEEFVGSIPVQALLTDIWHGKINPHVSSFRILICMFFWPFIFVLKLFSYDYEKKAASRSSKNEEKNEFINGHKQETHLSHEFFVTDLPFRVSGNEFIGFRLFYFLNAPIIKYVHHFLMHILMLLIFAYLILFDLWPLPMTQSDGVYKPKKFFALLDVSIVQMPISEIFIMLYMIALFFSELREVYFLYNFVHI